MSVEIVDVRIKYIEQRKFKMNTNMIQSEKLMQIENEIISLKKQTAENMILMGQKFIEAKELVSHGEWGNWLENKIGFSQRTVNQLMRIAKEYASNSKAISNLDVTKIYLLLELPIEERESFIDQNDLQNLSTREMKKRIKDYKRNNEIWKIVDKEKDINIYEIPINNLKPFPDHEYFFGDIKGENYICFLRNIKNNGVICPILITRDNMIISGHQRVRACKDLGIETIPATYIYCKKLRNRNLNDLLLQYFISSNMHTRLSIFYLALAWNELYFGDNEKAHYYMDKFVNEGEEIDMEAKKWIEEKRKMIEIA